MDKNFKVEAYSVERLEKGYFGRETRYRIVSLDGKVLDDAQGYGYKTAQNAHACWGYKNRDKKKDAEIRKKEKAIKKWLMEHEDFCADMEDVAVHIYKGSYGPDAKFDAKAVRDMLKSYGLKPEFTKDIAGKPTLSRVG